jgi:hypothetical protein
MPADRHQHKKARTNANAQAGSSSGPRYKTLPLEQRAPDGLPGVNKLKASLRSAKRLLLKVGTMRIGRPPSLANQAKGGGGRMCARVSGPSLAW